jgi:hypothetical protein
MNTISSASKTSSEIAQCLSAQLAVKENPRDAWSALFQERFQLAK